MPLQDIDIRGTTKATADQTWSLLGDSTNWPSCTPIEEAKIVDRGRADGLGEVRIFKTGHVTVKEEIVERREPKRLSFKPLGGIAVREYRADIDLTGGGETTEIGWHTTCKPKVPGRGRVDRRALHKATQDFVDGLAERATRT